MERIKIGGRGMALVSSDVVCRLISMQGLGMLQLQAMNLTLLT